MKNIVMNILLLLLANVSAYGQIWDELFRQKKTQLKYLSEQIVALKVYIGHVERTYQIAKDGLDFIDGATRGEFNLHEGYFNSRRKVSPQVKGYSKIQDIYHLYQGAILRSRRYLKSIGQDPNFSAQEKNYLAEVFARALKDAELLAEELDQVISTGMLEMRDDERIARIDKIGQQMQDDYNFIEGFGSGVLKLGLQRSGETAQQQHSKKLNGIK